MTQIYADEMQAFVFICENLRNLRVEILLCVSSVYSVFCGESVFQPRGKESGL
jgi:hypothetical protein